MKKKIIYTIIVSMLLSFIIISMSPMSVSASEIESRQMEFVVLLDVSASMGADREGAPGADPMQNGTRLSIEAIKNFIWKSPSYADVRISLIIYHHDVAMVFKKLNVRTNGDSVSDYLDSILRGDANIMENIWNGSTNIKNPLQMAKEILDETIDTSVKKGVILFTDGRIEIDSYHPDGPAPRGSLKAIQVENECVSLVEEFKKSNIHFYSVGLNDIDHRNLETLDREFLRKLGIAAEQEPFIVDKLSTPPDNLDKLIEDFEKIFRDFWDIPPRDPTEVNIKPGIPHSESINIYGEITREVNISITTGRLLNYIKVYAPNNDEVIYDSIRARNPDNVIVNQSVKISNIKIIDPPNGEWIIEIEGSEGDTVKINQIHLYEISILCIPKEENKRIYNVYLFNNSTQRRVTSETSAYEDAILSYAIINKSDLRNMNNIDINWEINEQRDGYEIDLSNLPPGEYRLDLSITKEEYFNFIEPFDIIIPDKVLRLSMNETNDSSIVLSNNIIFYINLLDESGNIILLSPDWKVFLDINGKHYDIDDMEFLDSHYEVHIICDVIGDYSVFVSMDFGTYDKKSNTINYKIIPESPEIIITQDGIEFLMSMLDEKNTRNSYSIYISDNEEFMGSIFLTDGEEPIFFAKEDILYRFNLESSETFYLYYKVKEIINNSEVELISKYFIEWPTPSRPFWFWTLVIVAGFLILFILFNLKPVIHTIIFNASSEKRLVTKKEPLLITMNEQNANEYSNSYWISNRNISQILVSIANRDYNGNLAFITVSNSFPFLPRFAKKLEVIYPDGAKLASVNPNEKSTEKMIIEVKAIPETTENRQNFNLKITKDGEFSLFELDFDYFIETSESDNIEVEETN